MILTLLDTSISSSQKTLSYATILAQSLGQTLEVVSFLESSEEERSQLVSYHVQKYHYVHHELLNNYSAHAFANALEQLATKVQPQIILAPHTLRGQEILTYLSAFLETASLTQVLQVESTTNRWKITRSSWGGNLKEVVHVDQHNPLLMTHLGAGKVEESDHKKEDHCEFATFTPHIERNQNQAWVKEVLGSQKSGIDLKSADIVVGGGRGVGSAEGFQSLEALGEKLKAAVGGSRVTTNNGWRPYEDQIGLTGSHISPLLYIACGISGAIQHMAGCKNSKKILVINKDEQAPIMDYADYAVIGDLHEVVPAILECL